MLPTPTRYDPDNPAYTALIALCGDMMLTPREVSAHFRLSIGRLANMRLSGRGPAWTKLEGAVRYPLSEIIAYELHGRGGPITYERIWQALSLMPGMRAETRDAILEFLRKAFSDGRA